MVKMDFGGVVEDVTTRKEFTVAQAQKFLKDEVVATLGYGIQGRSQALNMRDQGIKVIVGQRKDSKTYEQAVKDGMGPRRKLLPTRRSSEKGTIKMMLLTDARRKRSGQKSKKASKKATPSTSATASPSYSKNKQASSHPKTSTSFWLRPKEAAHL